MIYFNLKATLIFTKNISDLENPINNFLNNNKSIFSKGNEIGCEIEDLAISKNKLAILLKSNQLVRANDVLIRLKKLLSNFMGQEFKIGIRDVLIDFFDIKIESEKSIDIKKLPYVDNIVYDGNFVKIVFDTKSEERLTFSDIEKRIPDRIITLINNKIKDYVSKSEHL